ncbi:hypothetical protein QZH41_020742 [Actinostola sp. cb2023]|nr:hypothetical protein QZH41_020742 [Actinostola sp. cb2023]
MAAIAEISTFEEWDEEWKVVEEDFQTFKTGKFSDYQKKMDDFHNNQKACVSNVNVMKRRIQDFHKVLKRLDSKSSPESEKKVAELRYRIELLKHKIKEMQGFLPSSAGSFLRLCLGDINVSLYHTKLEYKDNYERFKLKMTVLCMVFAFFNRFVFDYRLTDSIFHGILVWYYSTLTLQEHILIANGSRIKGWWVLHHYFSILLSGFLLIWPEGKMYQMFRGYFFLFSLYLSFVQLVQYQYQSGVLYRLRALGISKTMDVTVDGFQSWMWRGLGFVLPFLLLGYLFQLYNAYILLVLAYHTDCREWQVMATGVTFFILFLGNFSTLLFVLKQKFTKVHVQKLRTS